MVALTICAWCGRERFPAVCDLECVPMLRRYGRLPDGGAVCRAVEADARAAVERGQDLADYVVDTRGHRWSAIGVLEPDEPTPPRPGFYPEPEHNAGLDAPLPGEGAVGAPPDGRCLVCGGGCPSRPPRPPTCAECWDIRSWRVGPAVEEWRRVRETVAPLVMFLVLAAEYAS
jgi:hypothetical protein